MSNYEKDQKEPKNNAVEKEEVRINQLLIFAFFIFLVLLSYLVRPQKCRFHAVFVELVPFEILPGSDSIIFLCILNLFLVLPVMYTFKSLSHALRSSIHSYWSPFCNYRNCHPVAENFSAERKRRRELKQKTSFFPSVLNRSVTTDFLCKVFQNTFQKRQFPIIPQFKTKCRP